LARLKKAQREDSDLKNIFDTVEQAESNDYVIQSEVLYKVTDDDIHVVIPRVIRRQVIKRARE